MPTPLATGFAIPTVDELITRISGDLQSQLSGIDVYAPMSDEWVLARVLAGASYLQHAFLEVVLRELFVGSASTVNLERIGGIWGITRNQPTTSTYTIEVEAEDALTIPEATLVTSSDGIEFLTDSELVFANAGTDTVDVTSVGVGTTTNLSAGATVTFASPIPDLVSTATVTAVVADGADIEEIEAYRSRILFRIQHQPQGGAAQDYILWGGSVDGVDRVWADSPTLGEVRVVYDGGAAEADVQTYIDSVRPVTAVATVIQGTGLDVAMDLTIHRLSGYSVADVEDSVEAALEALFTLEGATSHTIRNSELRQAVANAAGVDWFTVGTVYEGGVAQGADADVTTSAVQWHVLAPGDMVYAWA